MTRPLALVPLLVCASLAGAVCPTPDPGKAMPDPATCEASTWLVDGEEQRVEPPPGRCWAFFDVDGDGAWTRGTDRPLAWSALWGACKENLRGGLAAAASRARVATTSDGSASWTCTTSAVGASCATRSVS